MAPNDKNCSDSQIEMDNKKSEEQEKFLPSNGDTKVEIVNEQSNNSTSRCCKSCTINKCLIYTAIVILIFVVIITFGYIRYVIKYKGTAQEVSGDEILAEIQNITQINGLIDGIYEMNKYDENFYNYYSSMGIPSAIISMIIGYNDIYEIYAPMQPKAIWKWDEDTASGKQSITFRLGEEFKVQYGMKKKGFKHTTCNLLENNILKCDFEERKRGWVGNTTYTFANNVMVEEIDFKIPSKDVHVKTVRRFNKTTQQELDEKTAENNPFSDNEEEDSQDDWSNQDDFGDMDNEMDF